MSVTALRCRHHSCVAHIADGSLRGFALGYGLRGALAFVSALLFRRLYRRPKQLLKASFLSKNVINFGLFLGSYNFVLRTVDCILRRFRSPADGLNAFVAGALAGASAAFSPSSEIALYLFARALESLFNSGVRRGVLRSWRYGDAALFALSCGFMFYAWIWEPRTLRPSYVGWVGKVGRGRSERYQVVRPDGSRNLAGA